jgi:hypothetical protein
MALRTAVLVGAVVVLAAACSSGSQTVPAFDATATSTTAGVAPAGDSSTTAPVESVEDLLDGVVGAHRTGNPVFLVQRVHPDLRDYYGHEACRALYEDFVPDDTANATIRSVSGPVAWSETFDGFEFAFADVYTVDVDFVEFGSTRRQDMQLARVGGRFYVFLDCGDPLIATTSTTLDRDRLETDEDGLFYVHRGSGDSEDILVPAMFRITYTGTASTCSLALMNAETGKELLYVTGFEGSGLKRIVLSEPLNTVYIADVAGCGDGELQVGPNP